MNIVTLYVEYFGKHPSADDAADMAEFEQLPEMTLRAAFDRTRRHAERPSWAYVRTVLERSTAQGATGSVAVVRRSVLCDNCGTPFDPDWMTCEGWWAFCKSCIKAVRQLGATGPNTRELGPFELCSEYSASAQIVRRHFGLETA